MLLADAEGLVRSGLRVLLDLLMDVRMPKVDGIQATAQIGETRGLEHVRVLILTTYDTDAYVFEALQSGASGFLLKDSGPAELLHAVRVDRP